MGNSNKFAEYMLYEGRDLDRPPLPERYEEFQQKSVNFRSILALAQQAYEDDGNRANLKIVEICKKALEEFWEKEDFYRFDEIREFVNQSGLFPESIVIWNANYREKENGQDDDV